MPHLSPMMWAFIPFICFILILCSMSFSWYMYYLMFPSFTMKNKSSIFKNWNW